MSTRTGGAAGSTSDGRYRGRLSHAISGKVGLATSCVAAAVLCWCWDRLVLVHKHRFLPHRRWLYGDACRLGYCTCSSNTLFVLVRRDFCSFSVGRVVLSDVCCDLLSVCGILGLFVPFPHNNASI